MSLALSPKSLPACLGSLLTAAAFLCGALPADAQAVLPAVDQPSYEVASLPDSPGSILRTDTASAASSSSSLAADADEGSSTGDDAQAAPAIASTRSLFITPGQKAPPLTSRDKVILGFRTSATPFTAVGWLASAGYSQALDGAPNYGQGWGPFGQRLGAAAARGISENLLSTSVFAPVFHEDPRYYIMGRGHHFITRVLYAGTRAVVTRSDSGREKPNFSLIAGNAAGSILTNAYYPDRNRDATTTVETFAGSIGGSALGFVVREFLTDALGFVHLRAIE